MIGGMDSSSIHDNELLKLSVDHSKREISLETVFREPGAEERTNVLFKDVLAYQFKNDSFGTILFSIDDIDIAELLSENWQAIQDGSKESGWLVEFSENLENSARKLKELNYVGFQISSSIGLSGWVIAKSKSLVRADS